MLFQFVSESKAFRNEDMVTRYSVKEMSQIFYAMMLSLHLLRQTRFSKDADNYVSTTLQYPMFDRMYLSTTDLANVIATLRNAKEYLDEPNVDLPILDIKRYFRDFKNSFMDKSFARQLFYKVQTRLKVNDSYLTAFRRDIVDSEDLSFIQKKQLGERLYQLLRKYEYKCDVLALLQKFMDSEKE